MQYNGGKKILAPKIVDVIQKLHGRISRVVEPFLGGGSVAEHLYGCATDYFASDSFGPLMLIYSGIHSGRRLPVVGLGDAHYAEQKALGGSTFESAATGFALSFGGKWWGGLARPAERYARSFNNWADRFTAKCPNIVYSCADFSKAVVRSGDVVYCDPPYQGTTGYKTGAFNSEEFFSCVREWRRLGADVFVSEEHAPFTLVASFQRNRNKNGNSSGREDRLFRVE